MRVFMVLVVALLTWGCGDKKVQAPEVENGPETVLIGTWETEGVDAVLGPVIVRMHLRQEGILAMNLVLDGGGQRSFPGTWSVAGEELVLRGAYFGADGESRVDWSVDGRGVLVLRDGSGAEQEWVRLE
jgi:hypothetical protein